MTTHRNIFLFFAIFACATFAGIVSTSYVYADGSQTYSTPGTYSFTVPSYATLTVQVWGGGGGGGSAYNAASTDGTAGDQSSFNGTLVGGGGGAGFGVVTNSGAGGSGGTASGGDVNTTGNPGTAGVDFGSGGSGGSAPNGGTGGTAGAPGNPGGAPGAGGGGGTNAFNGGGGGSGGYVSKAYTSGQLTPGAGVTVIVGSGGAGGVAGNSISNGGAGAAGQVSITYTSPLVRIIRLRGHVRLKGNIRLAGVTPVRQCAGTSYGGYCWYFSPASASCTTACATHGGCNLAGITAYGSSGSQAMCTALLTAMSAPAPSFGFNDGNINPGVGCEYVSAPGIQWTRDTSVTTCSADNIGVDGFTGFQTYRACSCAN